MNETLQNKTIIKVTNLTKDYLTESQTVRAVNNVNLEVKSGEFITFVGRSGSGKTTLLNLISGLDYPTEGKILFDGEDLEKLNQKEIISIRRKKIGIIFQSFSLLPLLSAYENVELPLRISGIKSTTRKKMTTKAIETVGLPHRSRHRPYELSGGEQQRIAIARAIVNEPNVILADEPTGELDSVNAEKIFSSFKKMVKDKGITILATTHDRTLLNLSDRVIEISDGKLV